MYKIYKYLGYLIRHKWFVFLECLKYGLIWQGIIHDYSKFFPDEMLPYAEYFYGHGTGKSRFYTPSQGTYEFNVAWLKHQHRNPHHWQHWVLQEDSGKVFALEIPIKFAKEMLCDWRGAGKAQGFTDPLAWYVLNKDKMVLADATRMFVESELGYAPNNS